MKKVTLLKLELSKFKGAHDFKLDLQGANARIMGDNATGKTTIADAFIWVLFDKDTQNQKDFEIKTIVGGETLKGAEHKVVLTIQVDDRVMKLTKIYKEKWTKKRGAAASEFSGHVTDYYVDDVPTKKKDYDALITSIINEDTFKLLTSPTYFNEILKWKEQREILMTLVGDVTDEEVISSNKDLQSVMDILSGKSAEDFKKMVQAQQRKINDDLKTIPARIAENQTQLSDVADDSELQKQLQDVEQQIESAQQQIFNIKNGSAVSEKRNQLTDLQNGMKTFVNEFTYESQNDVLKLKTRLSEEQGNTAIINSELRSLENSENTFSKDIETCKKAIERHANWREKLIADWHEVNNTEFEHKDECVCPTCDQTLPQEKIEQTKAKAQSDFNHTKSIKLENITKQGKEVKEEIDNINCELTSLEEQRDQNEFKMLSTKKKVEEKEEVLSKLRKQIEAAQQTVPDVEKDEKYQAMKQGVINLQNEINELQGHANVAVADVEKEVAELKLLKSEINADLAKIANVVNIKKRIEQLVEQEEHLANEYQKLSEQTFTIDQFIRTKVSMLEERINNKFKVARFNLFNEQINGGLEECCEVTVNGVTYTGGLNNAMRINVGLDIINTLSSHYETSAPIFIDNAESVTQLIDVDAQVIELIVSEQHKELSVEVQKQNLSEVI